MLPIGRRSNVTEAVEPQAIGCQMTAMLSAAPAATRDTILAGMAYNRLVPAKIDRIAQAARAKRVVLTHFVPSPEAAVTITPVTSASSSQATL